MVNLVSSAQLFVTSSIDQYLATDRQTFMKRRRASPGFSSVLMPTYLYLRTKQEVPLVVRIPY